jgi:putative endonuclease
MKTYYVYIITNYTHSVFYTGISNNLERRLFEHRNKLDVESFSAKYNLYKLLFYETFNNAYEAISAEKKVKKLGRLNKLKLIKKNNPDLKNLFE